MGGALLALSYALAPFNEIRVAAVLGVGGLAALALAWPGIRLWLPERRCQVSSTVMHLPPVRGAFHWGVELGTGVTTYVVTPAMYALLAVAVAQTQPLIVPALCGLYGCCRGAAIARFALAYAHMDERRRSTPGAGLEAALRLPVLAATLAAVAVAVT